MADSKSIEEAAKDVQYEVNMCFKALELYRRYTFCQPISDGTCMDSHIDGRLFFEAFLIHFRCLIYFFQDRPDDRDVLVSHFLNPINLQDTVKTLVEYKDRLDKLLAHVTFARQTFEMSWDEDRMARDLRCTWDAFIKALPEKHRGLFQAFG